MHPDQAEGRVDSGGSAEARGRIRVEQGRLRAEDADVQPRGQPGRDAQAGSRQREPDAQGHRNVNELVTTRLEVAGAGLERHLDGHHREPQQVHAEGAPEDRLAFRGPVGLVRAGARRDIEDRKAQGDAATEVVALARGVVQPAAEIAGDVHTRTDTDGDVHGVAEHLGGGRRRGCPHGQGRRQTDDTLHPIRSFGGGQRRAHLRRARVA